jgi:asparagine N-glycosylation enzyme membrane subunit Stt3
MNAYTILQYNRDYFNDTKAGIAVDKIKQWLLVKQNKITGLWNVNELKSKVEVEEAIRAAYHLYPIFTYDGENPFESKNAIDIILSAQNKWGGFTVDDVVAGACEDIDAIDPLIRFSLSNHMYERDRVELSLRKSMIWVLSNFNRDGGATFYIENEHHYGNHPLTSSGYNESNLFATWFRTLSLAYICDYLNIENNFQLGKFPGYEIKLENIV